MVRRARVIGLAVAAVGMLAVAAGALASMSERPRTDEVLARLTFVSVEGKERFCTGDDGEYREARELVTLSSTGDPRLTGIAEFRLRVLDNFTTGLGTSEGSVVIRDLATRRRKVEGRFWSVNAGTTVYGFISAHVNDNRSGGEDEDDGDDNGSMGTRLFAHLRFSFLDFTGQIGGTWTEPRSPAVIQSGRCTGPFQRFAFP
jgi:hypothetical protein